MSILYTPRTWVTSEVVTAAYMNNEIATPFNGIQAAWSSYTPVLTGAVTNPVINNGTNVGRYCQYGKTVIGEISITFGTTSTFGSGNWSITLPFNTATVSGRNLNGGVSVLDSSAGGRTMGIVNAAYSGAAVLTLLCQILGGANPNLFGISPTVPFTWASADVLNVQFVYETA